MLLITFTKHHWNILQQVKLDYTLRDVEVTTVQKWIWEKSLSEQDQENEIQECFIAALEPVLEFTYKKTLETCSRQLWTNVSF